MKEKKKRYNTNRFNNTLTDNKVLSYKLNHLTSLGQKKKKTILFCHAQNNSFAQTGITNRIKYFRISKFRFNAH